MTAHTLAKSGSRTGRGEKGQAGRRWRTTPCLSAIFAAAALGSASAATAANFQISALGLDTLTGTRGVEFHGMLSQASGDFFAPLPSLPDGIHVCAFSATFQDNDATHDLTATLERRSGIAGSSINNLPQVMAKVKSAGAN